MSTEKPRLGLWLWMWSYLLLTLVIPLALGTAGVWSSHIAVGVSSGCWLLLFVAMAIVPELKPTRPRRRARKQKPTRHTP